MWHIYHTLIAENHKIRAIASTSNMYVKPTIYALSISTTLSSAPNND
ncbi:hypothetical protein APHCR_0255 [Anaplasma phagocytophilum str. CR1007]|nr:hypothetical protein APHWEB_1270 [Anaplasma phagocytophilum str. Webster]KJV98833.1 hypothetical protein OTSANNIE_1017 [Anaplasma phagocytophilum str. Annie]KJZ98665.1 hypothetical protein APHCR_0255 [Anaplasma phagocytophilum str. CR1007]